MIMALGSQCIDRVAMIKVYIPIRSTELLDQKVEYSIKAQNIESDIELVINVPLSSDRQSLNKARDNIKMAALSTDKYVITQDNDIVHLFVDNFECMISFLDSNTNFGAVSLWAGRKNLNHITPECCLWRREVLANVCILTGTDAQRCCCDRYVDSVRKQGFDICYIDTLKRIREI
jgi:hypothetical protein